MTDLSDLGLSHIGTACEQVLEDICEQEESGPFMIQTHIRALDLKFGGIPYPGVITVCGEGKKDLKQSFIASLISSLSRSDHSIAILGHRPDYSELAARLLANRSGLSLSSLRSGSMDNEADDWPHFSTAFSDLRCEPVYTRDITGTRMPDVIEWLYSLKKSTGISVIIIETDKHNAERYLNMISEYTELAARCCYTIILNILNESGHGPLTRNSAFDMVIDIEDPQRHPLHPTSKCRNPVSARIITKHRHSERIMLDVDPETGRVT